jgi:hypothetical protein
MVSTLVPLLTAVHPDAGTKPARITAAAGQSPNRHAPSARGTA